MELRHLQHFLTIAECGSLSKAATIVGIAQPALSRLVRHLEDEIGTPLFYRNGRGVRLTEEGMEFQSAVGPLVRNLLAARDSIKAKLGVLSGPIVFGMPPSISGAIGARLVSIFLERYPDVRLQIMDGFSGYVHEWLVSGRVDMAIINAARSPPNVPMDPLMTVSLFHVAQRDSTVAADGGDEVPMTRLFSTPLVLPGQHHGLRRLCDTAAQKVGGDFNVIAEIDSLDALSDFVLGGGASTIMPHGAIVRHLGDPDLLIRRVIEPDLTMQFMIAHSLDRPTTPAMREIGRLVRVEVAGAIKNGRLAGELSRA